MHAWEKGKQGFLYGGGLGKPHQKPGSIEDLGRTLHYTLGAQRIPAILLQSGGPANNSSS